MPHRRRYRSHDSFHKGRNLLDELGSLFGLGDVHHGQGNSNSNGNGNGGQTSTVVSFVYVTASATFAGPTGGFETLTGSPSGVNIGIPTQQTSAPEPDPVTESHKKPGHHNTNPPATGSPTRAPSTRSIATSSSTESITTPTTVTTSPSIAAASSAATVPSTSSVSSGMSSGAKAGLAIGILLLVGLIAGAGLFFYRKRKRQEQDDNEKSSFNARAQPPPPSPPPASMKPTPSFESPRLNAPGTPSTPPQVSLTPVNTHLSHSFDPSGPRQGNAFAADPALTAGLGVAAAAGAAGVARNLTSHGSPLSPGKVTGNGHNPFQDPVNPFGHEAETSSSPATADVSNATPPVEEAKSTPSSPVSAKLPVGGAAAAAAAAATAGATVGAVAAGIRDEHVSEVPPPRKTPSPVSVAGSEYLEGPPMSPGMGPGPTNVHRVQMDFTPTMEDELELRAGQLVRLIREFDDGWARCSRMDGTQAGVAPRTCLSARPVMPRRGPPPPGMGSPGPRGPPAMRPDGRPMSPMGRPMSPGGRPMSPAGRPMTPNGRSMSPAPRPMSPSGNGRSMSPGPRGPPRFYNDGRPRSPSHPFPAPPRPGQGRSISPGPGDMPRPLTPSRDPHPRSMSPGPYGPPGAQRSASPGHPPQRVRANSASGVIGNNTRTNGPPGPSPLSGFPPGPSRNQGYPPPGPPPNVPPPQGPIERKPVAT